MWSQISAATCSTQPVISIQLLIKHIPVIWFYFITEMITSIYTMIDLCMWQSNKFYVFYSPLLQHLSCELTIYSKFFHSHNEHHWGKRQKYLSYNRYFISLIQTPYYHITMPYSCFNPACWKGIKDRTVGHFPLPSIYKLAMASLIYIMSRPQTEMPG